MGLLSSPTDAQPLPHVRQSRRSLLLSHENVFEFFPEGGVLLRNPGGHSQSRCSYLWDSHELGFLWPGIPSANQNRTYVKRSIGMALGSIDIANGQICFRSNDVFNPLPVPVGSELRWNRCSKSS